jgi:hypothetical protein
MSRKRSPLYRRTAVISIVLLVAAPAIALLTPATAPRVGSSAVSVVPTPGKIATAPAVGGLAAATLGLEWTPLCGPCGLEGESMAFDPTLQGVVMFGGFSFPGPSHNYPSYSNATWLFASDAWSKLATIGAPPARSSAGMTFDTADGYMVLYGGDAPLPPNGPLHDTWTLTGLNWTQIPATVPSWVDAPEMAYDAAAGYVLMQATGQSITNESTWSYHAGNWTLLHPASQPMGYGAGISYDSALSKVVLFGGFASSGVFFSNATWEFDNGTWSNVSAGLMSHPSARVSPSIAYDPSSGQLLLFGGTGRGGNGTEPTLSDTWELNATGWTNVTSSVGPGCRAVPGFAWDGATSTLILFGGAIAPHCEGGSRAFTLSQATYQLSGTRWSLLPGPSRPPPRYGATLVWDPANSIAVLFGGSNGRTDLGDTWELSQNHWTQVSTTTGPSARVGAAATYDAATGVVLLFGGSASNVLMNDTWAFRNGTWTRLVSGASPPAREFAAMSYDPANRSVVLFGGDDGGYAGDTWRFQAGRWTNVTGTTGHSPGARYGAAMTYDPATGQVLLFGGYDGSELSDLWAYHAGAWTLLTPLQFPPGRQFGSFAYDPGAQTAVLFGGYDGKLLGDTWLYHAGIWTRATTQVAPTARELASAAYLPSLGAVVLVGGVSTLPFAQVWEY